MEIIYVFSNLTRGHQPDLSGRCRLYHWNFRGFFGVGGSFIAGPALRLMGVDWNYAVGTDLAHIVGKSIVAAKQHRALGNVDLKLGSIMAFGTIGGAECGAQLIQVLKRAGNVNTVVSYVAIVVYTGIAAFMLWESQKTLRTHKSRPKISGGIDPKKTTPHLALSRRGFNG